MHYRRSSLVPPSGERISTVQHRSKTSSHGRQGVKTAKLHLPTPPLDKAAREALEPAFSLFSAEAKRFPLILTLDQNGIPHRWITWQHAVWYYAKERVAWETGSAAFTVNGGKSRDTGELSTVSAASIIAIRGKAMAMKSFNQVPQLNNRELFHRDQIGRAHV